jgi:hypothetical protein
MTEEGRVEEKLWTLPGGKVKVQPILRKRGMIDDPSHTMYFLMDDANIKLCAPLDEYGNVICPLTEEERTYFEDRKRSKLPFESGDLSPFNEGKDNYWKRKETKVTLTKSGVTLDLNDPYDYIQFAILRSNKRLIATDAYSRNKKTCLFEIVSEDHQITEEVSKTDQKIEAYRALGRLEGDREGMIDFLTVYGKRPAQTSKSKFLVSEINKIIEGDIKGFLKIIQDEDYETRLLINKAVRIGFILNKSNKYELKGGDKLALTGEVNNLNGAINYLKAPENQDVLLTIKAQLEKANI